MQLETTLRRLAPAAVCLILALLTGAALAGDAVLTPELVVDLVAVGDVALAPDGDTVAYTLEVARDPDDEPGRSYKQLWLADSDGTEPRPFVAGKERLGAPAFSPDGKLVTFLVEREDVHDGTQIWAIPRDGGEARPLTRHHGSVDNYRWSPDGTRIAFAAKDAKTDDESRDQEAGRDWVVENPDPQSTLRVESQRFRHLHVLDLGSGESRRLIAGDADAREIHWTPDGKTLVFQGTTTARVDDEYMNTAIYALPVGTAAPGTAAPEGGTPRVVTATDGKLGDMGVSPDGSRLAYLGAVSRNDPLAQSVFVVPLAGGEPTNLTSGYEGSGAHLAWLEDGSLLLLAVEGERQALLSLDAESGERGVYTVLDPPEGEADGFPHLIVRDLDAGAGRVALAAETPSHPAELFIAARGHDPVKLSRHNAALDDIRLARQDVVSWTGPDDWTIRGVLTYPLDYRPGERYPLVLQVHGGPEGVSLDGWTTSAGYPVQLLAARGYMVLQPNYRGSQGRGVAYSKADHDDLGGKEFDDILAGVDALIERGLVDPDRVGTGGWSYGGYMSAWAATRWTDRFAASVVAAGLTNWISFAGTTDIPYEMSLVHWNSWWFDQPELHWRRSPMAHLDQASTPTLVVTGAVDERVHPEQARQLYTGLRIKGVPTELVFYPREPHGLRERAHRLDFIERTLGWFDKHLAVPTVEGVEEPRD